MKIIILLSSLIISLNSPCNNPCGVEVVQAFSQSIFNKNIGYYVKFENNSGKSIDAIEWSAKFYNNFDEFKGTRTGSWCSGNIIQPIEDGDDLIDIQGAWVDEATKVKIEIKRIHFTDGTTCK